MSASISVRSSILTRRSYCRPLDEAGTRFETFGQVLDRVIAHQRWLWERAQGEALSREQEAELAELRAAMDARRVSAAGRTLWLGGTELVKRREASSFNCSYVEVRTVHDVVDVFWNLLQGCGVGFKPVKGALFGFTRRMEVEVIRSGKTLEDGKGREASVETYDPATKTWTIVVGDSAEAWAKLAGKLVAGKHPARKLVIDLGEIRAGGSRLKGYGWICSGDGPLSVAIAAICEILNRRAGQLLTRNDIIDVVNWLGTVLSSRRSAEIAIVEYGDHEWREFATRKPPGFDSGPLWFRGQSNNSLLFWERPTKRQLRDIFDLMIAHGGGEPGFINGSAAQARAPWFGGLNPCAEILLAVYGYCVSGDTRIITRSGIGRIDEMVGEEHEVWNGQKWSKVTPIKTGENQQLLRVHFGDGSHLDCTPYHRFSVKDRFMGRYVEVEAKDLMGISKYPIHCEPYRIEHADEIDDSMNFESAYTLGVLVGDGSVSGGRIDLDLYGDKCDLPVLGEKSYQAPLPQSGIRKATVNGLNAKFDAAAVQSLKDDADAIDPIFEWGRSNILYFLAGWLDTDGCNASNGVRLYLAGYERAARVQLLLTKCGIRSSVNLHQKAGVETNYGVRSRDSYYVQITDCGQIPCYRLDTSRGREAIAKGKYQIITSVVPLPGLHDTFCFEEHETHKAVFGNVLTYQCNLSEIDLAKYRGEDAMLTRDSWLLARMNYRQTLVNLRDGVLQDAWHQTNENLRLCGVGITGIARRPEMSPYAYRRLRSNIVAGAYSMADELGLPRPGNVTTVKPSGTLSKAIFDTTEGAHKPKARHIFNNVNFSRHDPLVPALLDAGYRVTDHPNDPTSVLVTLPVSYPDVQLDAFGGYEVDRESAVSQMERYRMLMDAYCDQNVSITVSYDPSEIKDMVDWIHANWDSYVAMSFLFRNDVTKSAKDLGFAYLPQETVTRDDFEAYVGGLKPVDTDVDSAGFSGLSDAAECEGGACPVR